ncbi:MAG: hypothetical protein Q7S09_05860 [bacterium]|nr:hypothetical protein [bacterium]
MNEENKKPIQEEVLAAIKSGLVHMRPRWHFALRAALGALGGVILFLALLYLISFIFFALRQTGAWFVPVFGFRALYAALRAIPWLLVLLSLGFIAVLEILVRRYAFAYRRPLLYSLAVISAVVIFGGVVVAETSVHHRLFRRSAENRFPVGSKFYRMYGTPRLQNIHEGTIAEITPEGFGLKTQRGESLRILVTPQTRFPLGTDFAEDDTVVVFGERQDGAVMAKGIRKIDDTFEHSRRPGPRMHFRVPLPDTR